MEDPCFVFGCALDGAGGATSFVEGETRPSWLHIDYSEASSYQWLLDRGLDQRIVESLTRLETRPRSIAAEDGVLVALRGINTNPGAEPEDMVSLRLWIQKDRLISVRQRRLLSAQDVRESLGRGDGPQSIPDLVVDLIERVADRIAAFVDDIEDRIAAYEEVVETDRPAQIRAEVSAVRRQTAAVRRYLAPQRDALDALFRQSAGILDEDHAYAVREQSDRITRYVEDLDLVRERALVIQEELMNRVAQEQNARMYVLSIVAALFLPITFVTGIFGMNVAGLPGLENPSAFWVVVGGMAVTSLVIVALFRSKRWL